MAARAPASVTGLPRSYLLLANGNPVSWKLKERQSPLQTLLRIRTSGRRQQPIRKASPPTWTDLAFPIGYVRVPA